jgi:hypothetical protein
MESRLCAIAGGHPCLVLPRTRGARCLLSGLRTSHEIARLRRDAAFLCLTGLVGPGLATSLCGGTFRANVVTRVSILADSLLHVGLVCSNRARSVIGLARTGDIVTIASIKATHLSCAWLVCPRSTWSGSRGLCSVHEVTLLGFGAFGHPIGGLVCSSRARDLATSTRWGCFDVESRFCIYACLDSLGSLVGVVLARQALRLTG